MDPLLTGILVLLSLPVTLGLLLTAMMVWLRINYGDHITRIFLEKPLFIIPRGQPPAGADDVTFRSSDGLNLRGCYWKTSAPERRGVLLFGLEFGSNRWACAEYCEYLVAAGYDIFAWEPRNQGDSDKQPGFEPLQWVTEAEVGDAAAALDYLKKRPDSDPKGVGLYGVSKGANAGLVLASRDPTILCAATDGAFGVYVVMLPYMRVWLSIYDRRRVLHGLIGSWMWAIHAWLGVRSVEKERSVRLAGVERSLKRLRQPWLAIHGGGDTYIKPEMAAELVGYAKGPKELWVVPGAKHNQALATAGDEYRRRVLEFFDKHLAGRPAG